MTTVVNGIRYNLTDDIDTLIVKLKNKIDDMYMSETEWNEALVDKYETDLATLEKAFADGNKKVMQAMLNNYSIWFKRYR